MVSDSVNYWAVLVAGIAYMVLGALWYSPALLGGAWMKAIGKTSDQLKAESCAMNYVWGLITSMVAAYGVARIMAWTGASSPGNGAIVGLLAGVCFVFTSMLINDSFESRPRHLTIINVMYHLIGLVVIGIIVGALR